jgi:threonine dehydratase
VPDGGEPAAGPDAPTALRCDACGAVAAAGDPYPFRCPNADSDPGADHLLGRLPCAGMAGFSDRGESNPFVRFRRRLRSHSLALARGLADADFVALARSLDEAVAAVDRRRFVATPFAPSAALAAAIRPAPGEVWAKDETGNVSGSHKARHLMGIALHLEVAERTGLTRRAASDHRGLAIASCGNAALAAAVVARAAARPLTVYIPTDADPRVVSRLDSLAARIVTCERRAGETGDPCLHAFRAATAAGAIPFCCQGSENGLTIEGGMTLGWEIAGELAARGAGLDRLFVQVGGGALASATAQALEEAAAAGALPAPPRLHAVQTLGAFPLRRAYERVRARAVARLGEAPPPDGDDPVANATWAERLLEPDGRRAVAGALAHATRHRAQFMWPWETTPASVAHGILDDETYDWRAVVSAMLATGGWPVTVDESTLREARGLAVAAGIRADATGAAGLAGLIALRRAGLGGHGERTAVLFTGVDRATETP